MFIFTYLLRNSHNIHYTIWALKGWERRPFPKAASTHGSATEMGCPNGNDPSSPGPQPSALTFMLRTQCAIP